MINKVAMFCIVCAAVLHGFAADKYYLTNSETSNSNGGFYNPSYWKTSAATGGIASEDFDPEAEYVVSKKDGCKIYLKAQTGRSVYL